jgi:hypothetical protein
LIKEVKGDRGRCTYEKKNSKRLNLDRGSERGEKKGGRNLIHLGISPLISCFQEVINSLIKLF